MKKQEASPKNIPADYHDLIHEGLNGWMSIAAVYTNKQKNLKAVMDRWFVRAQREGADDYTRAICANSGSTRAILRRDIVSDEDWENDWFRRDFLHYFGVSDRLSSVVTLNDECEACIFLDRPLDAEPFTESEKNLIYLASAGTAELHKRMFLEHGAMVASSPLSKRERETYRYLLTEMSESQIADHMKLSAHTVHDYARGLYKKFGVKGRLGLMALVLGR
ncbi:hypothetical protein JIN77_09840 [Verrucomicrobiaceae bacterium R5-34]|uniref:HTH luxR-type domain-containing protein n=1 Tax=Oceaniferula flava TaxID=2800421 RepID=A0AAE2SBR7_9BACT|nr:LuxR C-terminal-related transcriptional regulator [Oceaniferula flavus]MBK1831026.1 hypothetical protein [Verrucomicrobiaceae bacterium R5-34]MBK1855543.1 hypothetical protein [Oceaniferula flavus]